jgi:peptide chain release factor subunit 3
MYLKFQITTPEQLTSPPAMSRLNAGAFEFIPGRGFVAPQQRTAPPPPVERPEQTEAPPPPPTISLNIGGSRAPPFAPVPATKAQEPASVAKSPAPATIVKIDTLAPPSKAFTTEKAKTDTTAIAQEVRAVADQTVLEDLFGTRMSGPPIINLTLNLLSQRAFEYRIHRPC